VEVAKEVLASGIGQLRGKNFRVAAEILGESRMNSDSKYKLQNWNLIMFLLSKASAKKR